MKNYIASKIDISIENNLTSIDYGWIIKIYFFHKEVARFGVGENMKNIQSDGLKIIRE